MSADPRGSRQERGYDADHERLRRHYAALLAVGPLICDRCGRLLVASDDWDLGHTDDRTGYTGPEHRACNIAARNRFYSSKRAPEPHPNAARPRG